MKPGVPPNISSSPLSDGNIEVSWDASTGSVTYYYLEYQKNGGNYDFAYEGASRIFTMTNLPIASYTFRVKACKQVSDYFSCSGWRYSSAIPQTIGIYQYQYDALGRLTKVIDTENREIEYDYDEADNRLQKTIEQQP